MRRLLRGLYSGLPSGTHINEAKAINDRSVKAIEAERAGQQARQDADRRKVFAEPLISAYFVLPSRASDDLTVSVKGFTAPLDLGTVRIPRGIPAELCYINRTSLGGSAYTTCAMFDLHEGRNYLPLTLVELASLPGDPVSGKCGINSSRETGLQFGAELLQGEGYFVVPGEYQVQCTFHTTRPKGDPATETAFTRFTAKPLVLQVNATSEGSRAAVSIDSDGRSVTGRVRYYEYVR